MKFNEEDFLIKDGVTVVCSLSPRLPNTRGVRSQIANGYLLAEAEKLKDLLSKYVEDEQKKIRLSKLRGIAYKPSEQFTRANELINYLNEMK